MGQFMKSIIHMIALLHCTVESILSDITEYLDRKPILGYWFERKAAVSEKNTSKHKDKTHMQNSAQKFFFVYVIN